MTIEQNLEPSSLKYQKR